MNYEQANNVKELAPKVNKVLEELSLGCPECGGLGAPVFQNNCFLCNGTGKTHYSWTPQRGEWYLDNDSYGGKRPQLVRDKQDIKLIQKFSGLKRTTPILDWQEIERVLEKAGYDLIVDNMSCNLYEMKKNKDGAYFIAPDNPLISVSGKDRQLAIMKAVLELGKEE